MENMEKERVRRWGGEKRVNVEERRQQREMWRWKEVNLFIGGEMSISTLLLNLSLTLHHCLSSYCCVVIYIFYYFGALPTEYLI